MTITQNPPGISSKKKNKQKILVLLIPLISCIFSSIVGVLLGQMGNIFYKIVGDAGNCLTLPGFCGLFLVTFGLSFLVNKLLRKWLIRPGR